jgi:hypothetical protein
MTKELLAVFAFLDELVPRGKKYGERVHHLKIGWLIFVTKNVVDKNKPYMMNYFMLSNKYR